ncbi:MAG: hypothetical protein CMC88_02105 [Flavobacteriaceae bacterium]|nr:hypothetical protein [Flavobacteriaceae bacterium]|tara:strand:- start:19376 stop:20044 length:669 start_codon:yes stop_codon:yes gene_type:complete
MNEWILRSTINNNWVFYICFFNLIIFSLINQAYPKKINHLFNLIDIDKNVKTPFYKHFIIEPFNVGSFLIISSSISLFFYQFYIKFIDSSFKQFDFFLFFLIISTTLTVRFFIVKSIFSIFSKTDYIETYLVKNQSYNTFLSINILIILLINEYSFINKSIILIFLMIILIIWIIFNLLLLFRFIKNRRNEFLYLIFYLCAVKISPWLWIYYSIYEARIKLL